MSFVDLPRWCRLLTVAGILLVPFAGKAQSTSQLKPVVGKDADGRLEVFALDANGSLRHRWQKETAGDWSTWSTIGDRLLPGFALANGVDGRIALFAVDSTDHSVKYMRQLSTNTMDWSDWTNLGGPVQPPLAAGQNSRGGFEVFATGVNDKNLHHIWQSEAEGAWSSWAEQPANLLPGVIAARTQDGRFELFGRDATTSNLVHSSEIPASGISQWSPWKTMQGPKVSDFVAGRNVLGILEVFAMDTQSHLFRITQKKPDDVQDWSDWQEFGENLKPGIALGQSADGRLEIFAVSGTNNLVLHRWETFPNGSDQWSAWGSMEHPARPLLAVGQNEDGNLELFAVNAYDGNAIDHRRQISKASGWLDWSSLDQPTFQYSSRTWQVDEGLPNNNVQAIAQTKDGYLWIGTREGLAKFDGLTFTAFNSYNTPLLQNSSVTALCADTRGGLWIGTDGSGMLHLVGTNLTRLTTADGLAGNTVKVIHETSDGSLWVGTLSGLSQYRDGRFSNYYKPDGLLSDIVSYLCEDKDHNLWIATGDGLNRLHGKTMDAFKMPNNLPNDSVRGICQDRGGRIWIGSNNGMLWYNAYWGKSFFAYNTRYGLSDSFVSAISEDQEGNLWVGTYSGLNRFREGRFFAELNNEGVPYDKVNTLFEDREGNLWVGLVEGLVRLTPKRFSSFTKRNGLSHNNVMSVCEDHAGGLWVATWGGGVDYLKDEKVKVYNSTNGLTTDLALSTCETSDGSFWIGTDFDGGLIRLNHGESTRFTSKNGLIAAPVRVLHEDPFGTLWVGTPRGLCAFKGGSFTSYTTQNGLTGNSIRAICHDAQSNLWVGTESGLTRISKGKFKTFTTADGLGQNVITALLPGKGKNLWIGTANGGLSRYAQGVFRTYSSTQGLFSDEILEILEDDLGWLWMSCSHGIFRVAKNELDEFDRGRQSRITSISYGSTDGIESVHCNGLAKPGAWKTHEGRLFFATSKGLASVYPATVTIDTSAPPVYIEQVFADRKPVLTRTISIAEENPGAREVTRVKPGRGELEFAYTGLCFQAPENTYFKYKLEGVDTDWIDAGTKRSAHYNNVYPGTYRFRVMACNKDGTWNEAGASLSLILVPHVWQTSWFRWITILVIVGAVAGTARYFTAKKLERKLALLQQRHAIERERGRIARDIHDDLGSSLTRILMLGERAEEGLAGAEDVGGHVEKIVSSARHTVQSLDEIVWAVNPENDSLEGLVEYISHFANEFFENTPVRCHLEIPVQLPDFVLAAEFRHDIFLVVKEAFNNIAKHAGASRVKIAVSVSDGLLQIVIEDDGRGFNPVQVTANGHRNGLQNMQQRVQSLGGIFAITSAPLKGARIEISAKLTRPKVQV